MTLRGKRDQWPIVLWYAMYQYITYWDKRIQWQNHHIISQHDPYKLLVRSECLWGFDSIIAMKTWTGGGSLAGRKWLSRISGLMDSIAPQHGHHPSRNPHWAFEHSPYHHTCISPIYHPYITHISPISVPSLLGDLSIHFSCFVEFQNPREIHKKYGPRHAAGGVPPAGSSPWGSILAAWDVQDMRRRKTIDRV